eukprot:352988-Chlamydomonas_euryale.AAC.2
MRACVSVTVRMYGGVCMRHSALEWWHMRVLRCGEAAAWACATARMDGGMRMRHDALDGGMRMRHGTLEWWHAHASRCAWTAACDTALCMHAHCTDLNEHMRIRQWDV